MSTARSTSKRRRISNDEISVEDVPSFTLSNAQDDAVPPGEDAGGGGGDDGIPDGVELLEPVLDDVAALVIQIGQRDDVDAVLEAIRKLCHLMDQAMDTHRRANPGMDPSKDAVQAGAPAAIICAMKKWQTNEEVQWRSCRCIVELAHLRTGSGAALLVRIGGVEAIVNAMKLFPNIYRINSAACCALYNLMGVVEARTTVRLKLVGVWDLVATTMAQFPDQARFQKHCCGILCFMAVDTNLREAIEKSGAVEAVARVMRRDWVDEDVKKFAKMFMKKMYGE